MSSRFGEIPVWVISSFVFYLYFADAMCIQGHQHRGHRRRHDVRQTGPFTDGVAGNFVSIGAGSIWGSSAKNSVRRKDFLGAHSRRVPGRLRVRFDFVGARGSSSQLPPRFNQALLDVDAEWQWGRAETTLRLDRHFANPGIRFTSRERLSLIRT